MFLFRLRLPRARAWFTTVTLIGSFLGFVGAPEGAWAHAPFGDAIISNGTVQLGVHEFGHLNVPGGTPSSGTGTSFVGLRYVPTNAESTAPGCLCEGWGAADAGTATTGYANESVDGVVNLTPVSFTTTASTAKSVVTIGSTLEVTHDYKPSPATPNLYEVTVSIKNITGGTLNDIRYRRVMDWDIEPTAFNEFVTAYTGGAANLLDNNNDGFTTANPLGPDTSGGVSPIFTGDFTDAGPNDHGARFDFGFGALASGATRTFTTYYGAAADEAGALAALAAVGAEVYSLGQANVPGGPTTGIPNTFIFAFGKVGGTPVGSVCDAPPAPGPGDIVGTSGPDQLRGTAGPDRIFGGGGDDEIVGLGGDDVIFGGDGNDKISGGDGNDTLCGGDGNDWISGGAGDDKISGNAGNDDLSGGDGNDTLSGGDGDDRLDGGPGTNTNDGGNGTDRCVNPAPGTNCSP